MRSIRRIASVWQSRGAVGLARFLIGRVFSRRSDLVFEMETAAYAGQAAWEGEGYMVQIDRRNLAAALTPQLRRQLGAGEGADYLEGLKDRDMLFAVLDEHGRCLHHTFVLFDTRTKRLLGEPPGTPLFAHCVTVPGARGRKLYQRTLRFALGVLHARGHRCALINCAPDNTASIRAVDAVGFRLARRMVSWIVVARLGWQTVRDVRDKTFRRFFLA